MSQQNISILNLTMAASGTVVEYRAAGFDGAQATTQGQKVMGAVMTAAGDGEYFGVVIIGTAVIESGAAVNEGDSLISDAQGRAIPATGGAGEFIFADAIQGQEATASGQLIEVLLRR